LKAVHHILASSAETIGAFNTGFDTVILHRPTLDEAGAEHNESAVVNSASAMRVAPQYSVQVEIESII